MICLKGFFPKLYNSKYTYNSQQSCNLTDWQLLMFSRYSVFKFSIMHCNYQIINKQKNKTLNNRMSFNTLFVTWDLSILKPNEIDYSL